MNGIRLQDVTKRFADVTAVDKFSLQVEEKGFYTLLGPSGCGKTTTLRCLAGLEEPDEGDIYIGDQCVYSSDRVIDVLSGKRNLGLVFQNYALWPHMTTFQNVAFGLRHTELPKENHRDKVMEILELLNLGGLDNRYPHELSGGQQQRVAVARMVVTEPDIFLFDEPLSNLDAKLRMTLRAELKRMHTMLGATTLYVTHDQIEAMTLSSQIVVMRGGIIQQVDSPEGVYQFPTNLFVAEFMGNPSTNLLTATVESVGPPVTLLLEGNSELPCTISGNLSLSEGQNVVLNVRPEDVRFETTRIEGSLAARVFATLPTGAESVTYVHFIDSGSEVVIKGPGEDHRCLEADRQIWIHFHRGNVYDEHTESLLGSFGFDGGNT